jgi:Holliday junction resolvasome RuvABC endonuclease subunit
VLCFDQTLANCGWALMSTQGDGTPRIVDSGTIRPIAVNGAKGFDGTFSRAVGLAIEIRNVLDILDGQFEQVVLELPAVVGYRTESSLVAASTICVTLTERGLDMPHFVSRHSAGAKLCGDRLASKNQSSEVVNGLLGDRHPTGKGQWTEHVRDAVFVGLRTLLEDR